MQIKVANSRKVSEYINRPWNGSFSLDNNGSELNWYICREQFASQFTATTVGFYFSHSDHKFESIAAFITKTEEILEINSVPLDGQLFHGYEGSVFAKTNRRFITWVEPSLFWRSCVMRRSLFTILLRCAQKYDPELDNYEAALYSEEYARCTIDAIKRFLFGFTKFNPSTSYFTNGWVTMFENKNREEIKKHLVYPVQKENCCIVGANSLWE